MISGEPKILNEVKPRLPEICNIKGYTIKAKIGQGGQERAVFKAEVGGGEVALKKVPKTRDFRKELEAVNDLALNHNLAKWIAPYYACVENGDHVYLVQEFAKATLGDLKVPIEWDKAKTVLAEVALGVELMHQKQYTHNDLKPDNLGVDEAGHIKILDLGLHRKLDYPPTDNTSRMEHRPGGTELFMAPEICAREPSTYNVDVFSFGILAYHLLLGLQFMNPNVLEEHSKSNDFGLKKPASGQGVQLGQSTNRQSYSKMHRTQDWRQISFVRGCQAASAFHGR